jgi:hypothetical protein
VDDPLRSLVQAHAEGDVGRVVSRGEELVGALADAGDYEKAARMAGAVASLREGAQLFELPEQAALRDRGLAMAEEALGTVRLAELLGEGRQLSADELVSLALEE